ncbi:hypothetical protein [Xanthomonas arboricola]|uniref:hypothetical protein n=1 Tax=Xanthomonas arboricola TaxID=56448 RepID=UPI001C615555|nr:hypothetical protein [Xanthomonas arboricola]
MIDDTELPEGRIGIGAEDGAGAYPADLEWASGEGSPGAGSKYVKHLLSSCVAAWHTGIGSAANLTPRG